MAKRKTIFKEQRVSDSIVVARTGESMNRDLANYVTTTKAAEMLGVGQNQVRSLLARTKIEGMKLGHEWLIYAPSVESYLRSKSPRGRPSSREPKLQVAN